ncbi:MAG: hypothetical protein Q9157_004386 [Trypethelium eluteriae]
MALFSVVFAMTVLSPTRTSSSLVPGPLNTNLQTVHQFPDFTWMENMAVRKNGQILGTDLSAGKFYLVDPQNPNLEPPVLAQFPDGSCVLGIAEVQEDVFYTQTIFGDGYTFNFQPNTSAFWEVDMRKYSEKSLATVRKITDLPAVGLPNGMTLLSKDEGTVLIADSTRGLIWRVNVHTGTSEVVFDDPLLKPISGAEPSFGVNGVRIVDSLLYFTSYNQALIASLPISHEGRPTGPATVISSDVPTADDFAVDGHGNIWLTENVQNTLVRVSPNGQVQTIAGGPNSTDLIGPVSAAFGRGYDDRDTLYISTDGLTFSASGEILTSNGKIAAIDTKHLCED